VFTVRANPLNYLQICVSEENNKEKRSSNGVKIKINSGNDYNSSKISS
jgi:hypothetical protein